MRFAAVGVFGAIVDFGTANLLVLLFHAPLVIAGAISFIAAILNNFLWNRYWTYPDSRSKSSIHQFIQFVLISVMGLIIRVPILHWLEPPIYTFLDRMAIQLTFLRPDILGKNITLAVAVLVVMFWNFFANRYWTYGDVE
jgi:putative flippase GtrA